MASGKKNYFRHSFFARNDDLVMGLIDKFGYKGYFFWFALLEICGEQAADDYPEFFKFHESRLYRELRCNKRSLKPVLEYLATSHQLVPNQSDTSPRLVYNHSDKFYEIRIPNFAKYLGKYQSKLPPNTLKKRKEKESKEKKSKEKESKENTQLQHGELESNRDIQTQSVTNVSQSLGVKIPLGAIMNCFNAVFEEEIKNGNVRPARPLAGSHLENLQTTWGYLKNLSEIRNLFLESQKSDWLMGRGGKGSPYCFTWVVKYDNAQKVLDGAYQNKTSQGTIDFAKIEKELEA